MRIVAMAIAALLVPAGAAYAKADKDCAAQWTAMRKSSAPSSQTRAQFMTTCKTIGASGGAPKPLPAGNAKR